MILPMIDVPVSLVGTFAVMTLLGYSLNNISLFGLVLAIGIVVDDAIGRAGEHRTADGHGPGCAGGDHQGYGRNHRPDPRDHAGTVRGVRPVRLHSGHHGSLLSAIRRYDFRFDDYLRRQRHDDDAVAGHDDL